jgi:hypothetical protein
MYSGRHCYRTRKSKTYKDGPMANQLPSQSPAASLTSSLSST